MTDKEIRKLYSRLHAAADKFWPFLSRDEREDRVANTVCEAVERFRKDEKHTISWWAKFMWGTSITASLKNREDPCDGTAVDLWAGYISPSQDSYVDGRQALRLCGLLPEPNRTVLYLRIDGANPIEIADETGLSVDRVIDIISRSRSYFDDGGAYFAQGGDYEIRTGRPQWQNLPAKTKPKPPVILTTDGSQIDWLISRQAITTIPDRSEPRHPNAKP